MDFLDTLALKSGIVAEDTGAVPLVQPRVPARFEPATPASGMAPLDADDSEALADAASQMTTTTRTKDRAASMTPRVQAPESATATEARAPTANVQTSTQSRNPAIRVIERMLHRRETHTIRVIERAPDATLREQPQRVVTNGDMGNAHKPMPLNVPAQPLRPPAQTTALTPKPVVPAPPRLAANAAQVSRTQPADEQPAIHINIGRIDVRATAAPKSRPQPRDPRRENDLERYLNTLGGSGNGGGAQ